MKHRYRLWKRNGIFYSEDCDTGKQISLKTGDRQEALRLIAAKNEAAQSPVLNIHLARTYLSASDPATLQRCWSDVFQEIKKTKTGSTKERWERAAKDSAFTSILQLPIFETRAEHFLRVLERGLVCVREPHCLAFSMHIEWLVP
ncbi:MAG: hypothetical protein HYY23_00715 [Verrucomicrobia bacterium]|nr:hypothetical protein [Verrucomicrobiota bacterium]